MAKQAPMQVNPSQASAWIHNPLAEAPKRKNGLDLARLFSTHPPTEQRVARLRAMSHQHR
jgi:heat shock protein HtpX